MKMKYQTKEPMTSNQPATRSIMECLDAYGYPIEFKYRSSGTYQTKYGGALTLLTVALTILMLASRAAQGNGDDEELRLARGSRNLEQWSDLT